RLGCVSAISHQNRHAQLVSLSSAGASSIPKNSVAGGKLRPIEMFAPLWNRCIDGFGNHAPGGGREKQQRPAWDVLHPGRSWAEKLQPPSVNEKGLLKHVSDYIKVTKSQLLARSSEAHDRQK
ncbi:MAG TPA: Eco29kI family restriction endonuclease, partial [Phycisphaerales bacterium]|nr:Eco29kI family restriction endonuclease [Phycisphaerales bacterium]